MASPGGRSDQNMSKSHTPMRSSNLLGLLVLMKSRAWMNMFGFATYVHTHTYHLSLNMGSANSLQKQEQNRRKAHGKLPVPRCTSRWHVCDMSGIQKWEDLWDAVAARGLMAKKTGGRMKVFCQAQETRSHAIVWHLWSFIKTKFHLLRGDWLFAACCTYMFRCACACVSLLYVSKVYCKIYKYKDWYVCVYNVYNK